MTTDETSTPTTRGKPAVKEVLRAAADREHRSIADMGGRFCRIYT